MLLIDGSCLLRIEIRMLALLDTIPGKHEVGICRHAGTIQACLHAMQHTPIQCQNRASAASHAYQADHPTPDPRNAGHFGFMRAIESQRKMIGHLCGA